MVTMDTPTIRRTLKSFSYYQHKNGVYELVPFFIYKVACRSHLARVLKQKAKRVINANGSERKSQLAEGVMTETNFIGRL